MQDTFHRVKKIALAAVMAIIIMATQWSPGAKNVAPVFIGRPLPWLLLQLLSP